MDDCLKLVMDSASDRHVLFLMTDRINQEKETHLMADQYLSEPSIVYSDSSSKAEGRGRISSSYFLLLYSSLISPLYLKLYLF